MFFVFLELMANSNKWQIGRASAGVRRAFSLNRSFTSKNSSPPIATEGKKLTD